jgi:hypothetical protein
MSSIFNEQLSERKSPSNSVASKLKQQIDIAQIENVLLPSEHSKESRKQSSVLQRK